MKKLFLLLLPLLIIVGCSSATQKYEVYLDNNQVSTNDFLVKVNKAEAQESSSSNYSFSISLFIKNISSTSKDIKLSNLSLIRESTNASYSVASYYSDLKFTLDSEIQRSILLQSTIPSSLTDRYCFSIDFQNINYVVRLYETPDELRKDMIITYKVDNNIVHTETVKEGRAIVNNYVYEEPSHQQYIGSWVDDNNKSFKTGAVIYNDVTLKGIWYPSNRLTSSSNNEYSSFSKINYVHSDGVVVVPEKYQDRFVYIETGVIYNNDKIKEAYIPKNIVRIYTNNFKNCKNLKTIYFGGNQEEWEKVFYSSADIPTDIHVVYSTTFSY